ncbi:LacI family DNA-binding transcriptional regulator [Paenibacillus elgii]|uniref:LacI family DNA-binding transcriptional regulator n=1 Tax=Paenibacillus elgii TaxID=189691 RepID=UPI000FDC6065|nr:LacI family DNA-binding transcriptional regulator [Paenibacillus elgii]NEN83801.1 LacI family DNA-binding transcriptional regulator [Paenibacillus elgii]
MANIKEIARMAGVSVTTVSRVLNRHPYVSEDKRAAVMEAVRKLDYVQNLNAVHLIKGKTSMIAVVLPYVDNPYLSSPVEGILSEANRCGYRVVLCQTNYRPEEELKVLEMLRMKQVDGVIITSRTNDWDVIKPYLAYGPIVVCEDAGDEPLSCAYIDHYRSFETGLCYLTAQGHRHVACCIGRRGSNTSLARERAVREALAAVQEPLRPEWIFYDALSMEAGVEVAHRLAGMNPRPTAVLAGAHQTAAGLVAEARKLGLRVPDDLAVIGFDNHMLGQLLDITAVEQSNKDVGRAAFQMLHRYIAEERYEAEKQELPVRLVERSTV